MAGFTQTQPLLPDILSLNARWRARQEAAVFQNGDRLCWGELDARLNRLANALLRAGLAPGDCAAVMTGNGRPMLEILLGLTKAGIASAPLNLTVDDAALARMIGDSGAKAVFATPDQAARIETSPALSQACADLLRIAPEARSGWADYEAFLQCADADRPAVRIEPDAVLNIIYSSGTTGRPKGIVHTHQGRKDWASDLCIALRYHGGCRTLINIGMYSNISWVSLLCTVMAGGTLVIEDRFEPARFWRLLAEERITNASMAPVQYARILEADDGADAACVRALMSCGSPLHAGLKQRLFERLGPRVIELYGLTEGVITTLDPEDAAGRLASVGKPLPGTDLRILDDEGRELPAGEAGEIAATGRIVMPGYLNRPDADEEARWIAPDGAVWLKTGDIGKVDEEGFLSIVDRKKDMILSGGQNLYPQDIEAVFAEHPEIAETAVIAAQSRRWGETPLALVVPRPGAAVAPEAIKAWSDERLGRRQRVAAVEFVDALPRNPNGKILKRALRDAYADRVFD